MRTFQLEYTREASTMKQKIVIITSKYLHPFVEKAFEDFKEDCTVTIADYTNFDHITDIYRKYEKTDKRNDCHGSNRTSYWRISETSHLLSC